MLLLENIFLLFERQGDRKTLMACDGGGGLETRSQDLRAGASSHSST